MSAELRVGDSVRWSRRPDHHIRPAGFEDSEASPKGYTPRTDGPRYGPSHYTADDGFRHARSLAKGGSGRKARPRARERNRRPTEGAMLSDPQPGLHSRRLAPARGAAAWALREGVVEEREFAGRAQLSVEPPSNTACRFDAIRTHAARARTLPPQRASIAVPPRPPGCCARVNVRVNVRCRRVATEVELRRFNRA